jgi:hypothetical protein
MKAILVGDLAYSLRERLSSRSRFKLGKGVADVRTELAYGRSATHTGFVPVFSSKSPSLL